MIAASKEVSPQLIEDLVLLVLKHGEVEVTNLLNLFQENPQALAETLLRQEGSLKSSIFQALTGKGITFEKELAEEIDKVD